MPPPDAAFTAYLAAEGFLDELVAELGEVSAVRGRLVLAPGPAREAAWAENVWHAPQRLAVASIGETLLDPATVLAAPRCASAFPNGVVRFVEDRAAPPSRAYLKLWEALTVIGERPGPGDLCLDLGASPGGWSWVLHGTGARVVSVDKAPLDPRIAALPGLEYRQLSAFALDPASLGPVDWLFSDVVCYPARLYRLVETWLAAGTCRRFLCTIKFQGATDHETARRFAAIPNSRLMHLSHNKHELTWVKLG